MASSPGKHSQSGLERRRCVACRHAEPSSSAGLARRIPSTNACIAILTNPGIDTNGRGTQEKGQNKQALGRPENFRTHNLSSEILYPPRNPNKITQEWGLLIQKKNATGSKLRMGAHIWRFHRQMWAIAPIRDPQPT
jgi:hypothetical protein